MRDLRYALRGLLRSPGVFFITILLLATGIGATTAVFSAINHLLIRPLPFRSPDQLTIFGEVNRATGIRSGVSRETFDGWATNHRTIEALGALLDGQVFPLPGQHGLLHGARVSTNFFEVLGVRPFMGRTFVPQDAEPGAANVIVISHEFWSARWARDPRVLGRTLKMSETEWTVVGVLPPGFRMLYSNASVWVPLQPESARGARALFVIGRLRPGETALRASGELSAARASSAPDWTVWGKPLREYMVGARRPVAFLLFVIVGLMMLTACMNVGAVLTARATTRLKDVAIRISLGASGWRILRDSLAEAMILSTAGSAAGLMILVTVQKVALAAIPELRDFAIDTTVLAFTVGLTICATAVMTSGPAIVSSRALAAAAARKGARLRGAFVVAQTALAVALLVGVGVLVRSLAALQSTDPGFRSAGVIVAEVGWPGAADPSRAGAFVRAALERAASQPYVRSAAAATAMPLFAPDRAAVEIEGRGAPEASAVCRRSVSAEYLALFNIPLLSGRHFSSTDDERAPRVAIVNERAAQLFWPDGEVVGRRVRFTKSGWMTIIGVAANVRSLGLRTPPQPEIFTPFAQDPTARVALAMRVEGDPIAFIPALAAIVAAADPRAAVTYTNSMPALLDEQLVLVRALSAFGAVAATIALLLAGMGLYGAISCLYAQRTKEIGIRMALGATPRGIVRMVAASAGRLAGVGCLTGLLAGAAAGRLFQAAVFGTGGADVVVLAAAVTVTLVVVVVATYAPAARASRIEPAAAIRCE